MKEDWIRNTLNIKVHMKSSWLYWIERWSYYIQI